MIIVKKKKIYTRLVRVKYIFCPSCGLIIDDTDNDVDFWADEGFKCPKCDRKLKVER